MSSILRVALLCPLSMSLLFVCAQGNIELELIDQLNAGVSPGELYLTSAGNRLVFSHCDLATGTELWISDGTANGSELLRDLNTGEFDSNPADFFDAGNGTLFFYARTEETGYELWKTSGTSSSTELVKDINPGPERSNSFFHTYRSSSALPSVFLGTHDGLVYLTARTEAEGLEVWATGGTAGTTQLVKDLNLGDGSITIRDFAVNSIGAYFIADDGSGEHLYRTDGTSAGTFILKEDVGRTITVHDDLLYFEATDATYGEELWISDGTLGGTQVLKDITIDGSSRITGIFSFDAGLLFTANGDLWISDGTESGTLVVLENSGFFDGAEVVEVGGVAIFESGRDIWSTDGTSAGTKLLVDPGTGITLSNYEVGISVNALYFFEANDGIYGAELWVTDGTSGGTMMVADVTPGALGTRFEDWFAAGGRIYFTVQNSIYVSDGTPSGTRQISAVAGDDISDVLLVEEFNGFLVFYAEVEGLGYQLIRTNGTNNGTQRITDWPIREIGLIPGDGVIDFNGYTYFSYSPFPVDSSFIFKMTEDTIIKVVEIFSPDFIPRLMLLGVQNNRLIYSFQDDDVSVETEVYALDANDQSVLLIDNLPRIDEFTNVVTASRLFFAAGNRLFRTNGTPSTTEEIVLPASNASIGDLFLAGNTIYFSYRQDDTGTELWTTDGTSAGTQLVRDIFPGADNGFVSFEGELDGRVLFEANDGISGSELWISDGSLTGTFMVRDIVPGSSSSSPSSDLSDNRLGNNIFFLARDENSDRTLWRTNGTANGTSFVHDLGGGSNTQLSFMAKFKNEMYVSINEGSSGKLYKTNGTTQGTELVGNFRVEFDVTPIREHGYMFLVGEVHDTHILYRTDGIGEFEVVDTIIGSVINPFFRTHDGEEVKYINYFSSKNGSQFHKISTTCPLLLSLTQDITSSVDYSAQEIEASGALRNSIDVQFSANLGTVLSEGFSVEQMSMLEIILDGCSSP